MIHPKSIIVSVKKISGPENATEKKSKQIANYANFLRAYSISVSLSR